MISCTKCGEDKVTDKVKDFCIKNGEPIRCYDCQQECKTPIPRTEGVKQSYGGRNSSIEKQCCVKAATELVCAFGDKKSLLPDAAAQLTVGLAAILHTWVKE